MTQSEEILRIAAKGDGMTASGRFAAGAAPGDLLLPDGTLQAGPHRAEPACRHYGQCGGCQLQHVDEASLADFVTERVVHAARGQGLEPERVAPAQLSPPGSRRKGWPTVATDSKTSAATVWSICRGCCAAPTARSES